MSLRSRPDFWTTTTKKQLNFLQHVNSLLKTHGRAAVVVRDNALFGGGSGESVRRKLLHECDLYTVLRLPTGIFYARTCSSSSGGQRARPWTKQVWFYFSEWLSR